MATGVESGLDGVGDARGNVGLPGGVTSLLWETGFVRIEIKLQLYYLHLLAFDCLG